MRVVSVTVIALQTCTRGAEATHQMQSFFLDLKDDKFLNFDPSALSTQIRQHGLTGYPLPAFLPLPDPIYKWGSKKRTKRHLHPWASLTSWGLLSPNEAGHGRHFWVLLGLLPSQKLSVKKLSQASEIVALRCRRSRIPTRQQLPRTTIRLPKEKSKVSVFLVSTASEGVIKSIKLRNRDTPSGPGDSIISKIQFPPLVSKEIGCSRNSGPIDAVAVVARFAVTFWKALANCYSEAPPMPWLGTPHHSS